MLYIINLAVPPLTPISDPLKQTLIIDKGTVDLILVRFPKGCCNLVHLQIADRDGQVVPWNSDQDLSGDNWVITIPHGKRIDQPPYNLYFTAWSEDDTFTHTLYVRVAVTLGSKTSLAELLMGL